MSRFFNFAVAPLALVALAGCASTTPQSTEALVTPVSSTTTTASGAGGYMLTSEEKALECKQLTGRMQIRILEIRDYNERKNTTGLSRALQSGGTAVFGGTQAGLDPNGTYAKDRAMLNAYNRQLAAKNCKTYDLDAELKPTDFRETPTATIKPASGPATGTKSK